MKQYLFVFCAIAFSNLSLAQTVTFEDGTKVNVNNADFSYKPIRKASLGVILGVDGVAGDKYITGSYLQPEVFHIAANVGFSSASVEGTLFFTGKTKERNKSFGVKYTSGGVRTVNVYTLKTKVEKRKELGAYLAVNDLGHLIPFSDNDLGNVLARKQTTIYAGIAAVNYWHTDLDVDDNFRQRGQFTGRTVLAPFITLGTTPLDSTYSDDEMVKYGARLFYEVSNSFGFLGGRKKGRTNVLLRMGADFASSKNDIRIRGIGGLGFVYNFF